MISIASNLIIVLLVGTVISSCGPVVFPSAESKTAEWKTVYNEVSWKREKGKDIWFMKQSHHGPDFPKEKWDEIQIVVEKGEVSFYQLDGEKEIPHKAACLNCHSNGPRAIRPDSHNNLSLMEKARIFLMNLRIKTYGPLKTKNIISDNDFLKEPLKLPSCIKCHNNNDSLFSRGELTRQQAMAIEYMVNHNIMPPLGSLTVAEKKYIQDFVLGL